MNRLRRHLIESGTPREDVAVAEADLLRPGTVRVFGRHGQRKGGRFEMNARGTGADPLACRESHEATSDTPSTAYYARLGFAGLGAPAVRAHLADRPMLP